MGAATATTALGLARTREATVVGRLVATVHAAVPAVVRCGRRARSLVLQASGLAAITWSGWEVARPLGPLLAGVSLLTLEWLTGPET